MVRCGWMVHHASGRVCTCACVVLMVPVSGFLCRCLARTHLRVCLLPGVRVSLSGCTTHARHAPHVVGVPAGVVPHVLWISGSCMHVRRACMPHVHARGCLLPRSRAQEGGACWAGVPWVVDHACMCTTHIHTHTHVHGMLTHAHSCCMLITCAHARTHARTHTHTCIHV